jgi:hypothetical protein
MQSIKIHTHNPEKVKNILDTTQIGGKFWDYTLSYTVSQGEIGLENLDDTEWVDLPEFKWHESIKERSTFEVQLNNNEEADVFFKMFNHKPTIKPYIHYDLRPHPLKEYVYEFSEKISPKYPLYVITKGRWEKTLTINSLEEMGVDFSICVEPDEYDNYINNPKIDKRKVIKLPENFSKRDQGGIPVRNFVWQHAADRGFDKHWIIDDNIDGFFRWNNNIQKRVKDGVFFRIMEDFSDRYENLGLVSCQYFSFIPALDTGRGPYILNTRAYSCILIHNKLLDERLAERWRGKYNEDTDLSLRVLSTGDLCTVNFNTLLSGKQTTGSMKGGNTTTIYADGDDGRFSGLKKKFDELKAVWGDIVTLTYNRHKDGRPHHHISYTKLFHQKLVLKPGIKRDPNINEYNMRLVKQS